MTNPTTAKPPAEITLMLFVSLDGVAQAPGGPEEDTTGGFRHGGWVVPHFDEDLGSEIDTVFSKAHAFLLGRRTYEIFASHWPHVTDPADLVAKKLNTLPKYVASRSVRDFEWQGTKSIRDPALEVKALKSQLSGELQIQGSIDLCQTLIEHDLIDEYRLAIFPVLLGSGRRLFNHFRIPSDLTLVRSRVTSKGVVFNVYRRAGKLSTGNVILNADGTYTMQANA